MYERAQHPQSTRTSRGRFLATVATAAVAAPFVFRQARAASKELVFVTWGGTYRAALKEALIPFNAETRVNVRIIDAPELAEVKAQVQTGNVQWNVFDAINWHAFFGSNRSLWEQLDPARSDAADLTIPARPDAVPV